MHRPGTGLLLGYHGCDRETAEKVLAGEDFEFSKNPYDWLGHGVYFWENDPERAMQWAESLLERGKIKTPAAVGAVIDPGLCLDLTTQASLRIVKRAFDDVTAIANKNGVPLVENRKLRRDRDCAVFNCVYETMPDPKLQTIRGVLFEGDPLYDGTEIASKTHVQLAVRDRSCIKGVFRIPPNALTTTKPEPGGSPPPV